MAANHDKGSKNKKGHSSKKAQLSNQEIKSKTMTIMSHVITVILGNFCIIVSIINNC